MQSRRPIARVLFDEAHSEAWTIRPEVARAIQPSHPQDSSYALAAERLRAWDMEAVAHTDGPLDGDALDATDVLVIAHPSDPRWERTVPGGSPVLAEAEIEAIESFVRAGGGLVVLGEEEQDKYGNNVNGLLERFGIQVRSDVVSDYEQHRDAPHWVLADVAPTTVGGVDLVARVGSACFYRAATLELSGDARAIARAGRASSSPGEPLAAVAEFGNGRVVVLGDSDLFGDDCLDHEDHDALWQNLVFWAAGGAFRTEEQAPASAAYEDPAWPVLLAEVEALRTWQQPDGSIVPDQVAESGAAERVPAITSAIGRLAPHLPHQADYLAAVVADIEQWAAEGFGVPDFTRSLDVFRPDQERRDGIEHLVVFPMYKQNGSRDTAFEALLIRIPWPEWLAELERGPYDNEKYLPVQFVDYTSGYDSECAVLFPETVSVKGKPANHFGGIFCDREAERFRRIGKAAASTLRLNLPPDAAALLSSQRMAEDAFKLWDLVHDRAHSHGDLPFDPFMIRQRMPYWMYSLEELRCDLTAFGEAVRLEAEGMAVGRDAQYAILFDRLFRFPVTGTRIRNYDGLGGQLLFAYLHRTHRLHWTDNRLTIDWEHVGEGVLELRALVEDLYRTGIDRTKLQHWSAAHALVAQYVAPASGSVWAGASFEEVADPRSYIDQVRDDEFPLSIFYVSLQRGLEDALQRPARTLPGAASREPVAA